MKHLARFFCLISALVGQRSVSSLRFSDRGVMTAKDLGAAIDNLLATERQVPKTIVLITDGDHISTYENETQSEASRARDQNITPWGVGIGCTFLLMEDLCLISQALYLKDLTKTYRRWSIAGQWSHTLGELSVGVGRGRGE